MKIEIIRTKRETVEIDIELPYFYKQVIVGDNGDCCTIYGKVELNKCTSIHVTEGHFDHSIEYEIVIEKVEPSSSSCYFVEEYLGSQKEYIAAKESMLAAVKAA